MEPKDFARIILRRRKTVITAIVITVLVAFVGSMRTTPEYAARCEVLYQAVGYDPTEPNAKYFESIGSLADNARFIKSSLTGAVLERLKVPAEAVAGKLADVQVPEGEQLFILQVADKPGGSAKQMAGYDEANPGKRAGEICNAYAYEYVEFKQEAARDHFKKLVASKRRAQTSVYKQVEQVEQRIRTANGDQELALTVKRNSLLDTLATLESKIAGLDQILDSGIDGGGLVTHSAGGTRVGGNNRRSMVLGLLVGLMFGIGIALVREYLDDTVRDKESTQRELGLPVLANLPASDGPEGLVDSASSSLESARQLRATLASLGFPHDKRMLVIASTLSKSRATTLVSLAAAVAESGRTVLVIGSDLRAGRTHESFGIANTVGLANVVRGQVAFEKAIRPAPGMDGVYVLPCGPMIGNPGELLSSEEMAFTLRKARRWADVVLLDAPPVLAAADASILGAYADGVVLVLAAGSTNRAQASEAKEQLVAAGARVLGAVLIGSDDPAQARNGNGGFGDDLPPMTPYGDWGTYGTEAYSDSWYGDDVLVATARTVPRNARTRREPSKKTAASKRSAPARVATKPRARRSEPAVKPVARTLSGKATPARARPKTATKPRAATSRAATSRAPSRARPATKSGSSARAR